MNKQILFDLSYQQLKDLFNDYLVYLSKFKTKYHNPNVKWRDDDGTINVIVIRCNDLYVTNDMVRNNDYLCVIHNTGDSYEQFVFNVTADPKTRKNRIANLCSQSYIGNIRNHRWIPNRLAICQDNDAIWVRRYENNKWFEENGYFGINIHNSAGFFNSSLGCVILSSEDSYINSFRPLLKKVQGKSVPVIVMEENNFNDLQA